MPTPKRLAGTFTALDFQLMLLRRMADQNPEMVDDIRHRLNVSLVKMREVTRRWEAMGRSPHARSSFMRYQGVLGEPLSRTPRRVGDADCEAWLWPVTLWPGMCFEVLVNGNGAVWNEWLVRAPDAPAPELRGLEDLRPWSCTVDEVARAFPPARPLEGTAPTRWGLAFTTPDGRPAVAEFTWGLLQRTQVR